MLTWSGFGPTTMANVPFGIGLAIDGLDESPDFFWQARYPRAIPTTRRRLHLGNRRDPPVMAPPSSTSGRLGRRGDDGTKFRVASEALELGLAHGDLTAVSAGDG